jgi:hypothetical protein
MTNTVISLKKSATPSAQPTNLANGELAINYADGKLFYKHANGTILTFNTQGGNAFGTINANGTLVVAGTPESVVSLIAGNNISISADSINDTITINSAGGASVNIGDNPPSMPANGDLWWSSTFGTLFIYYGDGSSSQWVEATSGSMYANVAEQIAIAGFNKANNALANTSGVSFNGNLYFPTGNVGIGTTTPNTKLDVVGNITSSNTVFAIHFDNVSDVSFKENIQTINNSIQTLSQLNPVSFDWKNTKNKSYGLIAQEVEKILPTIVHQKPDGTKTINYIEIIAFLIQAIKEQQKQIDDINTHINNAE